MVNKRILLGYYEVPGYGGASTGTYSMFQKMQADGLNISLLNIIDEEDADYFKYAFGNDCGNPKRLPNVHNFVLGETLFAPHPGLSYFIDRISPDLIVADCYIAALLMKRAAPEVPVIYMTSSVIQVTSYLAGRKGRKCFTIDKFLRHSNGGKKKFHHYETEAIEISDLVITNSYLVYDLAVKIFPFQKSKVYSNVVWRAEWAIQDAINHKALRKPFSERDIDLLFVASSWLRPEKNYPLVQRLVSKCKNLSIHIVGEMDQELSGATCHGLIASRRDLFALMGRTKTLICPSHFDAAPHALYEASAMGCNIIATKNCGNWMICGEKLIAESRSSTDFLDKIPLSLEQKFEDNMGFFLESGSYNDLMETISIF